jgi:hypothetical protein
MKKILLLIIVLSTIISTRAQNNFPSYDSLRKYINRYVRNSPVESHQNLRLNTALNGLLSFNRATDSLEYWQLNGTLLTPKSSYYARIKSPSTSNSGFSDWPYTTTFNKSVFGVYGKEPSLDILIDSSSQFQIGALAFRSNKLATGGNADKFPRLPASRFSANAYAVIEANAFRNGSSPWTSTLEFYLGDSTGNNVNVPFAASGPGNHFFGLRLYHTAEAKEALFFGTAINRSSNFTFGTLNTFFAGNLNNLPAYFLNAPTILADTTTNKMWVRNASTGATQAMYWPDATRESITVSSAGTLTLAGSSVYVFSGTTTTWTLPAVAGTTGKRYKIKNRGSGNITLGTTSAANEIYSTSAVNSLTISAGQAVELVSDGTYYLVM